ncbi:hypothetical protein ACWEWU_11855 [Staphylococcus xylosus]
MNDVNCICDANVWIDACHCDAEIDYLKKYAIVGFIEQVHNEIIKFKNNGDKFRYIFTKYADNENLWRVLKASDLGKMEVQFIAQLRSKGFGDIDNKTKSIDNLGEYASLYYAYHMKIPYIHTTDTQFLHDEKDKLPGIQMVTWNEINEALSSDDNHRIRRNKMVEQRKQEMRNARNKYNKEKESEKSFDRLELLKKKINNNRNA